MKLNLWSAAAVLSCTFLAGTSASAQVLEGGSPRNALEYVRAVEAANRKSLGQEAPVAQDVFAASDNNDKNQTEDADKTGSEEEQTKAAPPAAPKARVVDGNIIVDNMPDMKTKDGSKRGTAAFVRVPKPGEKEDPNEDNQLIFLYYDNFKITRSFGGGLGCDVKFAVMTNLDQRLINLSVKLKWPGMTTSLSFDNVNPNIETYFNYALFGEGCYTMDKIPNIIVNRCRIKGMSQEKCAAKIRWLSRK